MAGRYPSDGAAKSKREAFITGKRLSSSSPRVKAIRAGVRPDRHPLSGEGPPDPCASAVLAWRNTLNAANIATAKPHPTPALPRFSSGPIGLRKGSVPRSVHPRPFLSSIEKERIRKREHGRALDRVGLSAGWEIAPGGSTSML